MQNAHVPDLFAHYKKFCYHLGRYFDSRASPSITRMIYQADLEMTPGMFTSLWIITSVFAFVGAFIGSFLVFTSPASPFRSESPLLLVLGLSAAGGGVILAGFPFFLQSKISNKKMDIERKLPYALSFMSILASSGATPLDILRRIAREDYGHISNEFRKVLFRVDILGEDAVSAMTALVSNTPSEIFRDICIDMTNIIYGGGGLKEYLEAKSRDLMAIRRQTYKEFVDSLGMYGEGYLGGIVMLITLAVLGIVISGALGIELGPFKPDEMFRYLIYLVTPLINIVFLQLLSVKYSTNP